MMRPAPWLALTAAVVFWAAGMGVAHGELGAWSPIGPAGAWVDALVIDPVTPTTLYANVVGVGLMKSANGGAEWSTLGTGLSTACCHALAIDPLTPTTLYAGSSGQGVIKSTSGGASWTAINNGLTSHTILALAVDPVTPSTVYAGTDGGVFKSANGGGTWAAVNHGLPSGSVGVLAIDPVKHNTVYGGTSSGVFKSTNAGASWSATGPTGGSVNVVAIDPVKTATLYAGVNVSGGGSVLKSTDGGGSWSTVLFGHNDALAIDPKTPTTLWAAELASGFGVVKSTDGGGTWTQLNTGLTNPSVPVLALDPAGSPTLYAGTNGGGIFALTMDRVAVLALFSANSSLLLVLASSSEAPSPRLSLAVPGCVPAGKMALLGTAYLYIKNAADCGDLKGKTVSVTSTLGGFKAAPILELKTPPPLE